MTCAAHSVHTRPMRRVPLQRPVAPTASSASQRRAVFSRQPQPGTQRVHSQASQGFKARHHKVSQPGITIASHDSAPQSCASRRRGAGRRARCVSSPTPGSPHWRGCAPQPGRQGQHVEGISAPRSQRAYASYPHCSIGRSAARAQALQARPATPAGTRPTPTWDAMASSMSFSS